MDFVNNDVELTLRNVFQKRCVECENIAPTCPDEGCGTGMICSLQSYTCDQCPSATCIKDPDFRGEIANASGGSKPNIGAIAGGVIGGIAVILIVTWAVWRFCIRDRRRQQEAEEEEWQAAEMPPEKRDSEFTMRRDARNSTHTVASMASTILTRASNVIQIAYIPGITNRSGPQSPDVLVPPVPPIPLALSTSSVPGSPYSSTEDSHYFMPGDLRDSSYTAYTDDPRNSYATRASITPSLARSSVATTIYHNDAIVNPMPATTIVRGKAAMVSVKIKDGSANNSPLSTPGLETPPVPSMSQAKIRATPVQIKMPSSGSNGSIHSTATMGKPVPLTITKRKPSLTSLSSASAPAAAADPRDLAAISPRPPTASSEASESDFEDEHARSRRSLLGHDRESQITIISDSPAPAQSPFMDMSSSIGSPLRSQTRMTGLTTVPESEESSRRVSREVGSKSPFGDENALR